MLISNDFEVAQPAEKVWTFFGDIRQVAACLPGAELTEELGDDKYLGTVGVRMGPVKLQFAGTAQITERDEKNRRMVVDASGADAKGRGQAAMKLIVGVSGVGNRAKVNVAQDLQLSGAAAQYGRGMISDVTAVLMRDFAANVQQRIDATDKGLDPDRVATAKPASGLALAVRAAWMALTRVGRRFFLPYQPSKS